jgi:hypothetical protein
MDVLKIIPIGVWEMRNKAKMKNVRGERNEIHNSSSKLFSEN